ncbi:Trypsin-like peptidase domain-containing protein [Lentzea xinjiangensis]|uniref:Trypsin-like peptidase domain-containing protein n=1 Tax=Lentzea xinjiangensis TaxID=402600 RepID=A0A1H9EJU5_9PSEU|nr:trypsin-like serine protease [Lentzea xinjiangensis]SEQ25288.1 Trypsin-like peptidase domain-containing protein [Lentzea xinjiangensis]
MRKALLATTLAAIAVIGSGTPALAIRGGVEAAAAYPFSGSLQRPDSPREDGHTCGVTLVAPGWAVTAGHCTRNNPSLAQVGRPKDWSVRLGSTDAGSGGEVIAVERFITYSPHPVRDGDIGLLKLKRRAKAQPVALPAARPAEGTTARIIGWGMTCGERRPECYPRKLREADTAVQPARACDGIAAGRELCIGAPDGSVAATNMDSGGPALVRDGARWVMAGLVSGAAGDAMPVIYTDVHHFLGWIGDVVTGRLDPPDTPVPDLEGAASIGGCSASVVRTGRTRNDDPALLLTNGHCVPQRPAPGETLEDVPVDLPVTIGDRQGYLQARARTTRLVHATMSGTDTALFRLDQTYAQLRAKGVKVFRLSDRPARPGDRVDIISSGNGKRFECTIEAVVPHLREEGYTQDNAYRYDSACGPSHGGSGAPIVLVDGVTVVGVHSTGNDNGEQCTANNPCEVAPDGTVTVRQGARYGQQVGHLTRLS